MKENLLTVRNYALSVGLTPARIYQLIDEGKVKVKIIDGIKFIDMDKIKK